MSTFSSDTKQSSLVSPSVRPVETLSQKTDNELVAVARKDPEVFGMLMERYEKPLSRYLQRLSGWATEEVSDMLQETFIKAYRNLNDFDDSLKFSSWLYRIAHNQAIDTLRYHSARPLSSVLPLEDIAHFVAHDTDIQAALVQKEEFERVREAIEALPFRYREVLILRFLEEKEYEEIMDILKKPKGSIATLIKRGRALLLERLSQEKA